MAMHQTQVALNLTVAIIGKIEMPADPEAAAKQAVTMYRIILEGLPEPPEKPIRRLPL
ncbi:hypothetical protein [Paenibacillus cymbidii]|uniref:hypothetical protein n=1 Tax=Paenibacillus cymbidii TaxID=1639034 RepID=UPI00143675E5|nr:hypothetical protein [Paenibacillus cymbidii]